MPQAAHRHVFVYGTLRRSCAYDINLLLPTPRFVGLARVTGTLYLIDWYPGLVLGGEDAGQVTGEVYEISPQLELVLDEFEQIVPGSTSEYFKREVLVEVDGRALACLVYEINPDRVHGKRVLAEGDWLLFTE